jgi:pimeloyl-ACP methyl ester carboxylesterase
MTEKIFRCLFLASLFASFLIGFASGQKPPVKPAKQFDVLNGKSSSLLKQMPRVFEENKGQADVGVKFISRGEAESVLLTANQATYQMPDADCRNSKVEKFSRNKSAKQTAKPCRAVSLRMTMLGANRDIPISGEGEIAAKTDYYAGRDESRWQRGISNFEAVRYRNVYDGIDAVFHSSGQNLEYDFLVSAGANPNLIQLEFDGAKKIFIGRSGDLIFKFRGLEIRHRRPVAYQMIEGSRREVSAKFVSLGKNKIGFKIGAFDRAKELIIDPIIYATYLGMGTAGGDSVNDIAVDGSGSIYAAMDTRFTRIGEDGYEYSYSDILIAKFNPAGTIPVYFKYIGGAYDDAPYGIDVDADGKVVVTGVTFSQDFPLHFAEQSAHPINRINYDYTGFFVRLYPDGQIQHSTYLGGNCPDEYGESVVADGSGNAYVVGFTCSANFSNRNGFQTALQGTYNAFLTKYDSFGRIVYSTFFGSNWTRATDVFTDSAGNAYVTGDAGSGVYTTGGAYSTTGSGFVAKFSTNLTGSQSLVFSTRIPKYAAAIAVDGSGNSWVAMSAMGFRTSETAQIIKLNSSGSALLVAPRAFGNQIRDLAVDGNGSVYFAANFYGGFDTRINSKVYGLRPNSDEIDNTLIQGTGDDKAYGVALGPQPGFVYVGGQTRSPNFPATDEAFQRNSPTSSFFGDGFFAKVKLKRPRNPLIFIPGIMGSSIHGEWGGRDATFWVNTYLTAPFGTPNVYNLTLDVSSDSYIEGLYPYDVVRTVLGRDFYKSLLDAFESESMGYRPYNLDRHFKLKQGCDLSQNNNDPELDPSLFVFPYDWRQDNNQTADKLKEYIQCVQQFYPPDTKIDIVAHSMGGLVARRYILQAQLRNEPHKLGKVITIASPFLGSPEAIYKLYTGGNWEFPASYVVLAPPAIKSLASHLPSMHQLFPSRIYQQFYGGIIAEGGDVNGNEIADEVYSFQQIVSQLNSDFPTTAPGTVGAGFHDTQGQDDWRNDQSGIEYSHLVAEQNQLNTTTGLAVKKSIFCRLVGDTTLTSCHNGILYVPDKGFGDKTVPTYSASRSKDGLYLGAPNSNWYIYQSPSADKESENKAEHTEITKIPQTHSLIAYLLGIGSRPELIPPDSVSPNAEYFSNNKKGGNPNSKIANLTEETRFREYSSNTFPAPPDLSNYSPARYLTIVGKTEVVVRDESGNTASIQDGLLNNQAEGLSTYEVIGDNSIMLTFAVGRSYTIEFPAGETPMGINLVEGRGNRQPTSAIRYNDLNFPANSNVKFTIRQTGAAELRYDADKDGEYETLVPPTAVVSGAAASDTTLPTVSINIVQQGNSATATITAQDSESGISRIWYSPDGLNFQIYTSALTLQYSSTPVTIYSFADDAVANRSGLYAKTFTFTSPPTLAVKPVLECVTANTNGTFTAKFGYLNENSTPVTIPIGSGNRFTPLPQDRGQTTNFQPGRIRFAFEIPFDGNNLVWTLRSPNGSQRTSTASRNSTRCQQ